MTEPINLQINPVTRQWVRNESVTVGTASIQLASAQKRTQLFVRNTSTGGQVVTINLGSTPAVAGSGIVMEPKESFSDSDSEGYQCYQGDITIIASAAGAAVTIVER